MELADQVVHQVNDPARRRDVDIGADGIGEQALVHGGLDHLNVAVDTGVGHVHDDSPVGGGAHFGTNLAGVVQDVLGQAIESVGGYVAGTEVLQHVGQGYGRAADVNHEADTGFGGGLLGPSHGFVGVPAGYCVVMHPHLDTKYEAGILLDSLHRLPHVDDAHVMEGAAKHAVGRQPDRADVQECDETGAVRRKDVVAHGAVVEESSATGINAGSYPATQTGPVSVDCGAAGAVVEVAVEVDESGSHQLAGYINGLGRAGRVDALGDGGDLAVLEGDVSRLVVDALGRVQQVAADERQVVDCGSHGNQIPPLQ